VNSGTLTDPHEHPEAAFRLDGRVAIVTGASSGLGRQFARTLARAGASLIVAARRLERLEELAAGLPGSIAVACDVRDPSAAARLVDVALERFGRLDVVVNNAGITDVVPALDETPERFTAVLSTNLIAPFAIARRAAHAMIESGRGGSIINVASIAGLVAVGQIPEAGYAASKGGLINLTRELATQWARRGVRVNALCPGFFETELTASLFGSERGVEWLRRHTPMGRGGKDGELDGALLFLAGDASSFVTGQAIVVDGGWTAV
jgi:NAD(P)-dependent dehydrogenase (short-subunit alcohol dehydrogenase family)